MLDLRFFMEMSIATGYSESPVFCDYGNLTELPTKNKGRMKGCQILIMSGVAQDAMWCKLHLWM